LTRSSPVHKKKLTEQIEARGFKVDELRSIYWKRDLFNIATFKTINDKEHDIRFTKPAHSLF
jgi:hypothetical protein